MSTHYVHPLCAPTNPPLIFTHDVHQSSPTSISTIMSTHVPNKYIHPVCPPSMSTQYVHQVYQPTMSTHISTNYIQPLCPPTIPILYVHSLCPSTISTHCFHPLCPSISTRLVRHRRLIMIFLKHYVSELTTM